MATITGGIGNDLLLGTTAADIIDGGLGADDMRGGLGNDTYYVDNVGDTITESSAKGSGIDTAIVSGASYTLSANVENYTLAAGTGLTATGNVLNNIITDTTAGGNTLVGGAGNDTYVVKAGDVIIENLNEGTDTVQAGFTYTLDANVENLTLTGTAAAAGNGNALDNVLDGSQNTAANVLTGNGGNDTFILGAGDTAVAGAGIDTIKAGFSYTLGANEDNLALLGTTAINGTGNALNNVISGNAANNTIDGGAGADTMSGGNGNDTYYVDNVGDIVNEGAGKGSGVDTVISTVSYTLTNNVENLVLSGAATSGTGNAVNNTITDNTTAGSVTLTGGAGNDTYVVKAGDVVVENLNEGTDTVVASTSFDLSVSAANVENLTLSGVANINGTGNGLDNVITGNAGVNILAGGLGNDTYYVGAGDTVTEAANEGTDTIVSSIDWNLTTTSVNVENLTLVGAAISATGDAGNNTITGNNNNNIIDGGLGADTMAGGKGNDTYYVDNVGDVVIEGNVKGGSGIDTVISSISYTLTANVENLTLLAGAGNIDGTGNNLANIIIGNEGNNVLTGGAGADTLTGGLGSDTFVLDTAATADKVTDFVSGTDSMNISMAGIKIGNGDLVVDAASVVSPSAVASGSVGSGFNAASELVVFQYNALNSTTNPLGSTAAALEIGSANAAFAVGDTRLFVVDDGTSSAVYLFTSAGADATVSASELTLLATLSNTAATTTADYGFVA